MALFGNGESSGFTIANAGLDFVWARVGDLTSIRVEGKPDSPTGQMLADLLSIDLKPYLLDLLGGMESIGDTIAGLAPLDAKLPLIDLSLNELLMAENYKIGDLLKLKTPVSDYFTKMEDNGLVPSIGGTLNSIFSDLETKLGGSVLMAALNWNDGSPELKIDMDFDLGF